MVVIRAMGGFANHLFTYALYRSIEHTGKEVCLDALSAYRGKTAAMDNHFERIFGIKLKRAPRELLEQYLIFPKDDPDCLDSFIKVPDSNWIREPSTVDYMPEVLESDDCYLCGYWQSEKFFRNPEVQATIKRELTMPEWLHANPFFDERLNVMRDENSVAVHVRLNDYTQGGNKRLYGKICTREYYQEAMERVLEVNPNAKFYIFSDNMQTAWNLLLGLPNIEAGKQYPYMNPLHDFYLMSSCRHYIIANSTFSWWASWLGARDDSLIFAPGRWKNYDNQEDIYTDRMIRIPIPENEYTLKIKEEEEKRAREQASERRLSWLRAIKRRLSDKS